MSRIPSVETERERRQRINDQADRLAELIGVDPDDIAINFPYGILLHPNHVDLIIDAMGRLSRPSSWTVEYWLERRWLKWRVCAFYSLMFPPDGGPSHVIGLDASRWYWLKSHAQARMSVLEYTAKYGQPRLHQEKNREADDHPNAVRRDPGPARAAR